MRTVTLPGTLLGTMFVLLLNAAPAHAQATGTWVSGVGDDFNPCSRTAPCKTFAGTISKTAINGEIRCLDPGGFGAVTITKSITIDCHEIPAFLLASNTTGVTINIAVSANDPLRTVRLRNLNINGTGMSGTVGTRTGIHGVNILSANNVYLDDMRIDGFTQFGIRDFRSGNGLLVVRNSIIRDNGGTAIGVAPTAGATVGAVIENSTAEGSNFGISAGPNSKMVVKRSMISGNVTGGVNADNTGQISIDDSAISNNGVGISATAGSTVRLSNNDIGLNGGNAINGATTSFGNNRIYPTVGTAPTPAGGDSHDKGQQ